MLIEREECRMGQITIAPNDLIIASIALAHNAILVTHNTKEFSGVKALKLDDWTLESKK